MYGDDRTMPFNPKQWASERASEKERQVYELCDKHAMLVGQNSALEVKSIKGSVFRTICTLIENDSSDVDLMKQTNY